jgi:hypothetical protein
MYSKIILMKVISAIKNDPNAIDPQWYHIPHPTALNKLTSPGASAMSVPAPEKYHMQAMHAIINYCRQIMKATTHNKQNTKYHMIP